MLGNGMTALPESPPLEHPWSGLCSAESASSEPGRDRGWKQGIRGHTEAERDRGWWGWGKGGGLCEAASVSAPD